LRPRARIKGGLTMRKDRTNAAQVDRRSLLKGAGLAIGAAAATGTATARETAAGRERPASAPRGYRESDDVRTYYKLARF
jgi:hypothetical protein